MIFARHAIPVLALVLSLSMPADAQEVADMAPREGWAVARAQVGADALAEAVRTAVAEEGLAVVTQAGPTGAAAARGIEVPENRVIGVFNNDVAVRVLRLSTAAMIEAPMRLYITGNADGTASLSYKLPSAVLAPYGDEGGAALADIGQELDATFARIADAALDR